MSLGPILDQKNAEKGLRQTWKDFFIILFDPWILLSIAAWISLFLFSQGADKPLAKNSLLVLINVFAIGLTYRFNILYDDGLKDRGRLAVRYLYGLHRQIKILDTRFDEFIEDEKSGEKALGSVVQSYEEAKRHCQAIAEQTESAIFSWQDTLSEHDINKVKDDVSSADKAEQERVEKRRKTRDEIRNESERKLQKLRENGQRNVEEELKLISRIELVDVLKEINEKSNLGNSNYIELESDPPEGGIPSLLAKPPGGDQ